MARRRTMTVSPTARRGGQRFGVHAAHIALDRRCPLALVGLTAAIPMEDPYSSCKAHWLW